MRSPFFYGAGGVVSADIAVPEHAREVDFYVKVLTTGATPLWRDDLMNNNGMPIIGLGERVPEYEALPLQWMPHFQVSDVAASAVQAVEGGGQEVMHGKGDDGQSQWACLVDPSGAAFGVIPAVDGASHDALQHEGAGRIAWLSLVVSDVASTSAFYERVLGWSAAAAGDEGRRDMMGPDGNVAAELCPALGEHEGIPSVWMLHLPVGDIAASLRQVRENGGEVVAEAAGSGQAIIRDPVGVYFALQDRV